MKDSSLFKIMTKKQRNTFSKAFISHKECHLHKINDVIIFTFLDEVGLVNIKSLHLQFFNDEESAVDHVLDFYKVTKGKQQAFNF